MKKSRSKRSKTSNIEKSNNTSGHNNSEVDCDDDYLSSEYRLQDKNPLIPPLSRVERIVKEVMILNSGNVPKNGCVFNKGLMRKAGDYLLGPVLGSSPVKSMVQCLGRKVDSDEFYTLKILTIRDSAAESQDDRQGKMLLHTEHCLLSFLKGHSGILKEHGLFEDYACDATYNFEERKMVSNGKFVRRICLVLDCVIPHPFSPSSMDYINLQHYVIRLSRLKETEALMIFYDIVSVVKTLHDVNVIHRDLKLANLVLNRKSKQITLTNFCLGQHLVSENDKLLDQRGSPAYISPDVLIGKPYFGKPSDMWALGVVLFTMLFGQFPFYHKFHQELFKMIKTAQYTIPKDCHVKSDTLEIIKNLLCLNPTERWTASEVLVNLTSVISSKFSLDPVALKDLQVVPDIDAMNFDEVEEKETTKDDPELEKDNWNLLDYLSNTATSQNDNEKSKLSLATVSGRGNGNYCYSTGNEDSLNRDRDTRNRNGVSVIEGDIRTFTQQDLYTHRNMFPHYSGSEIYSNWSAPSSAPTPPTTPSLVPPSCLGASSRPRPRVGLAPRTSIRAGPSRLSLSSVHFPSPSSSSPMYEFPPSRRWALNVMQKITANPLGKGSGASLVPQLNKASLELVMPAAGVSSKDVQQSKQKAVSSATSSGSSNDQTMNMFDQSMMMSPKPGTSGVNKKRESASYSQEGSNGCVDVDIDLDVPAVPDSSSNGFQSNIGTKSQPSSKGFKRMKRSTSPGPSSDFGNKMTSIHLKLKKYNINQSSSTDVGSSRSRNSVSNIYIAPFSLSTLLKSTQNLTADSADSSANDDGYSPTDPNNNNSEDANYNNDDNNNSLSTPDENSPDQQEEQ